MPLYRLRLMALETKGSKMAITGIHMLLYSSEAHALRATLRDVFGLQSVDAGDGWLIFALPPAELGVHPAEEPASASGRHQISFMCDDLQATAADLRSKGVRIDEEPQDEDWGIHVMMNLPGSVRVMLYEPRHRTAI
jgi:catechol 2,3-dioxygenase-like lactoylglutathione lyase family enzyme